MLAQRFVEVITPSFPAISVSSRSGLHGNALAALPKSEARPAPFGCIEGW